MERYPLLLRSNCILNFKGNIELMYAPFLDETVPFFVFTKYARYGFDNANLVILRPIVICISVGIIGPSKSVFTGGIQSQVLSMIIAASIVTCVSTSMILTIKITNKLKIDPDNVI